MMCLQTVFETGGGLIANNVGLKIFLFLRISDDQLSDRWVLIGKS